MARLKTSRRPACVRAHRFGPEPEIVTCTRGHSIHGCARGPSKWPAGRRTNWPRGRGRGARRPQGARARPPARLRPPFTRQPLTGGCYCLPTRPRHCARPAGPMGVPAPGGPDTRPPAPDKAAPRTPRGRLSSAPPGATRRHPGTRAASARARALAWPTGNLGAGGPRRDAFDWRQIWRHKWRNNTPLDWRGTRAGRTITPAGSRWWPA